MSLSVVASIAFALKFPMIVLLFFFLFLVAILYTPLFYLFQSSRLNVFSGGIRCPAKLIFIDVGCIKPWLIFIRGSAGAYIRE